MPNRVLCAAFAFALPLCCAAGEPDTWITTDRPDFVDAPEVVGKGRVQLETGILQSKEARSTPTLLRVGVTDDLEVRVESDGRLADRSDPARTRGWGDAAVSVKWQLHGPLGRPDHAGGLRNRIARIQGQRHPAVVSRTDRMGAAA